MTKPIHKLSNSTITILSIFIETYIDLKKDVLNEKLINKLVFDSEVRSKIMKELDISKNSLANAESEMRSKGVIINNELNSNMIPELDDDNLKLIIYFYK